MTSLPSNLHWGSGGKTTLLWPPTGCKSYPFDFHSLILFSTSSLVKGSGRPPSIPQGVSNGICITTVFPFHFFVDLGFGDCVRLMGSDLS